MQAYLTWERSPHNPAPKKTYDHLRFHVDVAEQIRAGFTSRKHATCRSRAVPEAPIAVATIKHHKLVKTEGRPKIKLQALVYDILPSTTAVFSYAIGSRKLSANEQFFVGAQIVVGLLQTTQNKACHL